MNWVCKMLSLIVSFAVASLLTIGCNGNNNVENSEQAGPEQIKQTKERNMEEREDKTVYHVVVNGEEQYSIWPADKDMPQGWKGGGKSGLKQECLKYIEKVWTDMRPLSLRKKMEANSEKRS